MARQVPGTKTRVRQLVREFAGREGTYAIPNDLYPEGWVLAWTSTWHRRKVKVK